MSGRIFRIELRRSTARWLALVPLPLVAIMAGEAGRGLNVIAYDQRQFVPLVSALVIGITAWQARRDRRSAMDELLATTARPRWRRVLPATGALALAGLAGYLLVFAGLAVYAGTIGGHLSAASVPTAIMGALIFLVMAAAGLVVGRWLPFIAVPPLALVYLVASVVLADTEGYTDPPGSLLLWGTVEAHSRMAPELAAVTARTQLAQCVWALALIAAGFIVFATSTLRARLAAVLPVVLGAVIALPLLPDRYTDAFHPDPAATGLICTTDVPTVCVLRAHHLALPGLRESGREALAILAAKLPEPPTRVQEVYQLREASMWSSGTPRPGGSDTLYTVIVRDDAGRAGLPPRERLWSLLMGAGTLNCDNAPPWPSPERQRYDAARLVAAAWLLDQPPLSPTDRPEVWGWLPGQSVTTPTYEALLALPATEQRTRVAALRQAELTCDTRDRTRLLTDGPS